MTRNGTPASCPVGAAAAAARLVEVPQRDRAECRVELLDPLDRGLDEFEGLHLSRRDECGLIGPRKNVKLLPK